MIAFALASSFALTAASLPQDADLIPVGGSSFDDMSWFVVRDTVARQGDTASAQLVIQHNRRDRPRITEYVELSADCRTYRYRPLFVSSYAPDGQLIGAAAAEIPAAVAQPRQFVTGAIRYMCDDQLRQEYYFDSQGRFTG